MAVAGNLIDNAVDAAAQARPRWVELTIVAAEHDLLIRVRDSGPGVPHDMREAIFMDGVTTKSSVTGCLTCTCRTSTAWTWWRGCAGTGTRRWT
jgi:two-component system CitB family sensor kinase